MAGFLAPSTSTAIGNAPASLAGDNLVLQTATTSLDVARLAADIAVVAGSSPVFTLASSEMVDLFEVGDQVRLIRSPDHDQKINALFNVVAVDSANQKITLDGFTQNADYNVVDLLVKTSNPGHPANITYSLDLVNNRLQRTASDDPPPPSAPATRVVADNITAVDFVYRLEDGTETNVPAATDLENIRGVRVTLTGTAFDLTTKGTKTRFLTKLVTLKNNE